MSYVPITSLIGKTLSAVVKHPEGEELVFTMVSGRKYKMFHDQDCCEQVWLEEIVGDLEDLVGSPIIEASERTEDHSTSESHGGGFDSATWTFYHLGTAKGTVVLRWCGESNGYYSERVSIECVDGLD